MRQKPGSDTPISLSRRALLRLPTPPEAARAARLVGACVESSGVACRAC